MRKLESLVERGLTLKELQILVDKRVVKEAEDALAVVHDIPETMADSTLYASVSTGAVPSAADTDRVFTKWHEQVQLSVAAGVEMPAARHAVSTRKWQRFCRCISRESQFGFCSLDRRDAAAQEEKVWVLEFVWSGSARVGSEIRVFDVKRTPTHRFPKH